MTLETIAGAGASWLWDKYGKTLIDKTTGGVQEHWKRFRWREAEAKYRTRVYEQYKSTRVLGNPKPIAIEDIFTDVYILDKPTAFKRYDLQTLQDRPWKRETLQIDENRTRILPLVEKYKRIFILGKPGAGKTTFLKYLVLQSCKGNIHKTPVFVSLKEWSDSELDLISFLVQQFDICGFPDAKSFIEHLLSKGDALILFDGLDEVNMENYQRANMITTLTNFAKKYPDSQICLTCRIAATDYSFTQFTYLEIADFNEKQLYLFASKWYQSENAKFKRFYDEISKEEHTGLRELARTPLLLALLCLAFDETLSFSPRRVDLYKEALDALLKKWDASRGIFRGSVYRKLSIGRKEQLLARLAAENFEAGAYFIHQDKLASQISQYLGQLPITDLEGDKPDGEAVLKAIEAQHGLLIERAHNIYSFSHLTFQEYYTARYAVENAADGAVTRLLVTHILEDRWREVILLTASMLDNADGFFDTFNNSLIDYIGTDNNCTSLLRSLMKKPSSNKFTLDHTITRASFLFLAVAAGLLHATDRARQSLLSFELSHQRKDIFDTARTFSNAFDHARDLVVDLVPDFTSSEIFSLNERFSLTRTLAYDRVIERGNRDSRYTANKAEGLGRAINHLRSYINDAQSFLGINLQIGDFNLMWNFTISNVVDLINYISATRLLLECLQLAVVSNRGFIKTQILRQPWNVP
jgi:hypothetical protein